MTLTVTVPWTEPSILVAVKVTVAVAVTAGAVNTPELDTVPLDADQITALLKLPVPVTTTVHVSEAADASGEAQLGTTEVTVDAGVVGAGVTGAGVALEPPPHPNASIASNDAIAILAAPDSTKRIMLGVRGIIERSLGRTGHAGTRESKCTGTNSNQIRDEGRD